MKYIEQYFRMESLLHPNIVLVFDASDYYEVVGPKAREVARITGFDLFRRGSYEVTSCLKWQLDELVDKLTKAGIGVAIANKVSYEPVDGVYVRQLSKMYQPVRQGDD